MKDEIYEAAKLGLKGGVLDQEIYDSNVIYAFASASKNDMLECNLDIPISSLVGLGPREFYRPRSTWRDAALGLHCDGWDSVRDKIADYFTSELENKPFPGPNSEGNLRIHMTGGAVYCQLGNHRAAAGKVWLAHYRGESAIFQKASCTYKPVMPSLKLLMEECIETGSTLKYWSHTVETALGQSKLLSYVMHERLKSRVEHLFVVQSGQRISDIYYRAKVTDSSEDLLPLRPDFPKLAWCLSKASPALDWHMGFQEVSVELMQLMLDDSAAKALLSGKVIIR